MGTGYTRNDTSNNIADGNVIDAADLDGEFDAIQSAFNASTGHTHDGTTAEGAPIEVTGPAQEYVSTATEFRPKTNNTYDLGSAALQWKDLYVDGTANIDSLVADTADINAGTIDGVTIGGASAAAGTFTTATATTGNITTVNATTVDTTNIEVTNIKAKDGTAAGSIADATGVVTLASSVLTTTDINGGTIDGVTIGGSSAGAITGTTITGSSATISGDLTVDTTTLHVDSTNNRVGIGTTSPQSALDVAGDIRLSANNKVYTDGGNLTISADNNNSGAGSAVNILVDGAEMADFNNAGYLRFNKANFAGGGICTQSLDSTLNLAGGSNPANSGLNIALSGPDHTAGSAGFLMRDGTATVYAYQRLTDAHLWYTDGSERMRVTSGGNVGIGTTNPGSKLSIVGLPTSSAGLSAGDIWNDSGTLKIVT